MQLLLATACALLAAVTGSMALPQAAQLSSKFAQIEITYTDSKTSTIFVEIKSERVQSFQPISIPTPATSVRWVQVVDGQRQPVPDPHDDWSRWCDIRVGTTDKDRVSIYPRSPPPQIKDGKGGVINGARCFINTWDV